jgi:hypothetical protein
VNSNTESVREQLLRGDNVNVPGRRLRRREEVGRMTREVAAERCPKGIVGEGREKA